MKWPTFSVIRTGRMPKKGLEGYPGLGWLSSADGRGDIVIPPVSERTARNTFRKSTVYNQIFKA